MRALAVACLAACYAPAVPTGAPCGPGAPCPEPLHCIQGTCELGNAQPPPGDAHATDGAAATPADARQGCTAAGLTCAGGYTVSECNTTCFVGCIEAVTQPVAEQRCIAWGGHLASILNSADALCAGNGATAWIGYIQAPGQAQAADGWSWLAGDPAGYTDWASGQPDDGNGGVEKGLQQCAEIVAAGTWDDSACSETKGFICR